MTDTNSLYHELKIDLQTVAEPLLDFACQQVNERSGFLPVGAKLTEAGETILVAAAPSEDITSSDIVLQRLIEALLRDALTANALAFCEWVKIEDTGGKQCDAIKVCAQHKRGLTVAFYVPATKPPLESWEFGEMIVISADPFIGSWPDKTVQHRIANAELLT
jgi:hypothetical protein